MKRLTVFGLACWGFVAGVVLTAVLVRLDLAR